MEKVCLGLLPICYGGFPVSSSKSRTCTCHRPLPRTKLCLGIKCSGRGGMEKEAFFPHPSCQFPESPGVPSSKSCQVPSVYSLRAGRCHLPSNSGVTGPGGSPTAPTHHLTLWGLCLAATGMALHGQWLPLCGLWLCCPLA